MPKELQIRPYEPADWSAIARVHDAARMDELSCTLGVHVFRPLAEVAEQEGLFSDRLWVAECSDAIVGFVAVEGSEVTWLYVDPTMYRRGIGRRLLREALASIGGEAITSVLDGNDAALRLYLAAGFEIVEVKEGHLQGAPDVPARGYNLRRMAA